MLVTLLMAGTGHHPSRRDVRIETPTVLEAGFQIQIQGAQSNMNQGEVGPPILSVLGQPVRDQSCARASNWPEAWVWPHVVGFTQDAEASKIGH